MTREESTEKMIQVKKVMSLVCLAGGFIAAIGLAALGGTVNSAVAGLFVLAIAFVGFIVFAGGAERDAA